MSEITIPLKIFLLLASVVSFMPQLQKLRTLKNFDGLSLVYVLLNLIVATEQFTLGLHLIAVGNGYSFAQDPPSLGDWFNVFQFGLVWLLHAAIFTTCFRLQPARPGLKTTIFTAYLAFFMISLAPVAIEATLPRDVPGRSPNRGWFSDLFGGFHAFLVSPVVTVLGISSMYFQVSETRSRTSRGALSLLGLACQAVIFTLVGCAWYFRLVASEDFFEGLSPFESAIKWFMLVGWATVDNLVFAFVQAVVFCVAWARRAGEGTAEERSQLLHRGA